MISLTRKVQLSIEGDNFSAFGGLFAYGFKLEVEIGCSLFDLLCRQIGISETYLNDRVQTIFLNGKVIDDISSEILNDNSVIALSAAMPGLVGAVFRKGGILSSMRSSYASQATDVTMTNHRGPVILKLFNLIASDLGSDFLKKGIQIKGDYFIRYINWKRSLLESVCRELVIDGKKYEIDDALSVCRQDGDVFLSINSV
ncbi:MAG: hypothetical protein HF978_16370 [Desulfobacteraceae bacterium]|nr:hypothetical protein [Desulfobacteraceae bacterium]MBC2757119.1 hypothetical protein [Desulfobacteraceae bacterium]